MEESKFSVENGLYKMEGLLPGYKLVELDKNDKKNKKYSTLYFRALQHQDLLRALEYLMEIDFDNGKDVINESLFNMALVRFIKCFANNKGKGRPQLDPVNIFKKFESVYNKPLEVFYALKCIRNKFIVHDQEDFNCSKVGLILNEEKRYIENVTAPFIMTHFNYQTNSQMLAQMINMALNFVDEDIDKLNKIVLDDYRSEDFDLVNEFPPISYKESRNIWLKN